MTRQTRFEPIRFAHMADTHLGAGNSTDRVEEIEQAFIYAFTEANDDDDIQFIIIAGDVFDKVRPSWDRLAAFIATIRQARKPVFVIAGNHDTARVRAAGTFWNIFDTLDLPNVVFAHGFESKLATFGDHTRLLLTPWGALQNPADEDRRDEIRMDDDGSYSIWVTHGVAEGVTGSHASFLRPIIFETEMCRHDYVALGDLHTEGQVQENAWYSGSTSRMNWSDLEANPHWLDVTLDASRYDTIIERPIPARQMTKLPVFDATGYTGDDLVDHFSNVFTDPDVMVSVEIFGCERAAYRQLLKEFKHFPFLKLQHRQRDIGEGQEYDLGKDRPTKTTSELFQDFLAHRETEGENQYTKEVSALMRTEGQRYFDTAMTLEPES